MSDHVDLSEPWRFDRYDDVEAIADGEWSDHVAERVERYGSGWEVGIGDGLTFGIPDEWNPKGIPVANGDAVRQYGGGFGCPIRGVAVNGRVVYYETDAEYRDRAQRQQAERDRSAKQRFEADERAEYEARIAALPDQFRARFARFHRQNPDFGWRFGQYELMCCEDALRIAETCTTPDAVKAFYDLPWEEQKRRAPGLNDGHSSNSFGFAVRLAHHWLADPALVAAEHGALAVLVGCEEYGCLPE